MKGCDYEGKFCMRHHANEDTKTQYLVKCVQMGEKLVWQYYPEPTDTSTSAWEKYTGEKMGAQVAAKKGNCPPPPGVTTVLGSL